MQEGKTGNAALNSHLNTLKKKHLQLKKRGIRNFWLIKCQRCKEENLSQRII